jgi:hypothetical protein
MQDFKTHLLEQLDFLQSSIAAYDAGKEHEAKRLSVPIAQGDGRSPGR